MVHKDATLILSEQQSIHHGLPWAFIFQGCSQVVLSPTHDGTSCEILKLAHMGNVGSDDTVWYGLKNHYNFVLVFTWKPGQQAIQPRVLTSDRKWNFEITSTQNFAKQASSGKIPSDWKNGRGIKGKCLLVSFNPRMEPGRIWCNWTRGRHFLRQIRQSGKNLAIWQNVINALGDQARMSHSGKILAIWKDFGNLATEFLKIFCLVLPNVSLPKTQHNTSVTTNSRYQNSCRRKYYWFLWSRS